MNEQYITLVGKVCSPRYEEVYTPEVKSKLPIEASSEGRNLKDYTIYGNNNPNHVNESQSTLPVSIDTYGGNAVDWEIYGNNNPVIETESNTLPIDISSSGGNAIDYTIYGNNNCNKNLLEITVDSQTINGVTFTVDKTAGTITANGTASANARFDFHTTEMTVNATDIINGIPDGATNSTYYILAEFENGTNAFGSNLDNTAIGDRPNFTPRVLDWRIYVISGQTVNNLVFKPMIRKADTTPDFEPYRIGVGENTEIRDNLPIEFRSNGDDLLGYKIYGTVEGTGVQTENLCNKVWFNDNTHLSVSSGLPDDYMGRIATMNPIDVSNIDTVTLTYGVGITESVVFMYSIFSGNTLIERIINKKSGSTIDVTNADTLYICFYTSSRNITVNDVQWVMLNRGSTPIPYEAYGYKLPLVTVSGTESKDTIIPIGDTKLMAGDYIDYKSGKIYKAKRIHEDTVTIDGIVWDILDYDHDEVYKADGTRAKHTVTIQTHDIVNELQYSAKQAAFAFPNGLAAGTYHFTVGAHPWVAGDVNKVLTFTLANAIPTGGQLVFNGSYNRTLVGTTISSFASPTITTAAETVTMTEGSTGTDLGTMLRSKTDTVNSIDRALRDSNNWLEGAMRQYINSDKTAGNVWTPQTVFDRPPAWASTTAGFLNGKSTNFISHIGTAKKTTGRNTITDGGVTAVHDEKLFLLSQSEAYMEDEYEGGEGMPYAYYKDYSDNQRPSTASDSNRIKYLSGNARVWWLRSPHATIATYVRVVTSSGAQSRDFAITAYGVAPACCIILDDADDWVKQTFYTEVDADLPSIETFNGENTIDSTVEVGETMITQGYRIPLQIKQGATTKTADIYIGNSPLTQGQSITKAQSGQDVTLFSGDNIIDTTLVNKPQVDLTYRSSVLGVGEKTTNLFDEDDVELIQVGTNMYRSATSMGKLIAGTYILSYIKSAANDLYVTMRKGTSFVDTTAISPYTFTVSDTVDEVIVRSSKQQVTPWNELGIYDIVLRRVGYQIPLLITSGQQSTPHTIYIGDSPLTEGQSISKTSTGMEIALYQGENTISTTLGNKPEMKIDYLSTVVGVGERTKNLFEITNTSSETTDVIITVDKNAGTVTSVGTPTAERYFYPQGAQKRDISDAWFANGDKITCNGRVSGIAFGINYYKSDRTFLSQQFIKDASPEVIVSIPQEASYYRMLFVFTVGNPYNATMYPMLRPADTSSTYIPYGYQIPIDIKQGDEVVDHKDIYIGTQPLVEGASVSKVSVGEDITLVSGKNYIDAVSFNKPEMYIK